MEKTLQEEGVLLPADDFKQVVADTFHARYPSWNDEDLMHHPSHAVVFCEVVRSHVKCPTLSEPVILRALSGLRKQAA